MKDRKRIFIVEDEVITAMEIRDRLQSLGFHVTGEAATGEDALVKIQNEPPDLVLMDIKLKGKMDGVEAGRIIKERYDIPIIFLSAYSDETTISRARKTQPFSYLLKPFSDKELKTSIELAVERSRFEVRMKRNEHWLMSLINHHRDGVIMLDAEGRIRNLNRRAEVLTNWNLETVLNQRIDQILNIEETTGSDCSLPSILRSDRKTEGKVQGNLTLHVERQKLNLGFEYIPVRDEQEQDLGSYLILIDDGRGT